MRAGTMWRSKFMEIKMLKNQVMEIEQNMEKNIKLVRRKRTVHRTWHHLLLENPIGFAATWTPVPQ